MRPGCLPPWRRARVGVKLIQRPFAAQRPVGSAKPFNGFVLVADHFNAFAYTRAMRTVRFRFGGRQQ